MQRAVGSLHHIFGLLSACLASSLHHVVALLLAAGVRSLRLCRMHCVGALLTISCKLAPLSSIAAVFFATSMFKGVSGSRGVRVFGHRFDST